MKNMTEQQLIKKLTEERDLALSQLASIGVGLGDNMDHVKKALEQQTPKNDSWTETCLAIQKILIEYGVEPLGELANAIFDAVPHCEENNNDWIPCNERLPEKNGHYLVVADCGISEKGYRQIVKYWYGEGQKWMPDNYAPSTRFVAWQPLPPPYKDGE